MISFECILARLTSRVPVPAFAQGGHEQVLSEVFADASNDDIQLGINNARLTPPMSDQKGFFALELHLALSELTQNKAPGPAKRIAVLFADYYRPFPPAFGVMFDRGFETADDPSSARGFRTLPREGCAVFLGAIADQRHSTPARENEALFTTIHELGHIFNLQHSNRPPNFLAQSVSTPYPKMAYQFLADHRLMLANCSKSRFVCPGGSPFQESGPFANHNLVTSRASVPQFGLELAISMSQREFWPFEPVELDIELRVADGVKRTFQVPDAVDPGYETFRIWIEEPSGERRRLRSPRRYCGVNRSRRIRPGRPFRRDVSIFGEAGGYTFRAAGVHRIWTEFEIRPGFVLRSNDLTVNVLPARDDGLFDLSRRILSERERAALLYHRLHRQKTSRALSTLSQFAVETPELKSSGSVKYALGRALLETAERQAIQPEQRALDLLKQAADSETVGTHQREMAEKLVRELSGATVRKTPSATPA